MDKKFSHVNIINPSTCYIADSVTIGSNVTIYENNRIEGHTSIGDNCIIHPNNYISNSTIFNNCTITFSHIENCSIRTNCKIGPFSHIRPNTILDENVTIGNFVEVKNSQIGKNTKASHHAYIGDAIIGKNCNIGCGVIFANYNGKAKNKCTVGDNSFIGSNSCLIAPLTLGKNTFVSANSTVTDTANDNSFIISRSRQITKENASKKYLKEIK